MRLPETKLYRKIRYRKGFGVHSPFVYNFITKVIEEKSSYYAFDEIEKFRSDLLSRNDSYSIITAKETQSANYGEFLFRIMNFFKCKNVVQIGCSTGVMSLYLTMSSPGKNTCYLLEERSDLLHFIRDFSMAYNLNKIKVLEGDYKINIKKVCAECNEIDLIFINQLTSAIKTEEIESLCKPLISKTSILILNDIIKNKQMKKLWVKVKNNPESRICLDLYSLGIVFFDNKLPKKNYKVYFNYGKKQNIHKNRRRGIYFSGWREKSIKNKSPYRGIRNSR